MKLSAKSLIFLVFGVFILLLTACSPVCTPVYNVTKTADTNDGICSSSDCSLREAVNNANACAGAQTINLPAGGYTLTIDGDDEDLNNTGDLDITDDLTIIGTGAPSIHGAIERSFHVHPGVNVTFDHIWLADGSAIFGGGMVNEGEATLSHFTCNYNTVAMPYNTMGDAKGGCIYNLGTMEIYYGQFLANNAKYGGAIYNETNGVLFLASSDFTGNIAEQHGGAILNAQNASLTINGGDYRLNEAGSHGGAIWNNGSFNGGNLTFEENNAVYNGGAVYNWAPGTFHFENVWFNLNSADQGGGLYNNEGMVHIYRGGLTANTASTGGGLYNQGPAPSTGMLLQNVTISGNTATGGLGAGIYTDSNFDFRFITVANNSGEGLRIDGGAEIKLRSSVLSNNTGGDCAGITPDSLDYNIVSDGTCALIEPHDLLATDPLLEPLAHNGGRAPSHALGVGSPAIDTGVPDLCIASDQPGTSRPQGPWCDRGAYENVYTKGIVRGWTYIDANRDDIRDPAEGAVDGVILELKEGPCPGGTIAETTTSASPDGFYEIIDIEPGDYCLDTSPLQQTMYPEFIDLTFGPGDVFTDVNFRYLLSPLGASSVSGKVWHDECAVPYATPSTPPPGCIMLPGGGLGADGIYDPSEPGIEGVEVHLLSGHCSFGPAATAGIAYTDSNGEFTFPGLTDGPYCVEVGLLTPPNTTILIPGNWTYPVRDAMPAIHEFSLGPSEDLVDVNFGWDYQFLPAPPIPYSFICIANQDAFGRFAPDIRSKELFVILKGEQFEVLAKSEQIPQVWWFGKTEAEEFGYVADLVLNCKGIDPEQVLIREAPEFEIIEPEQDGEPDQEPDTCTEDLDPKACKAAGGIYVDSATRSPYCDCP